MSNMEPGVFRAEHVTPIDMTQVESLTEKEALAHEHCSTSVQNVSRMQLQEVRNEPQVFFWGGRTE